jgi:hypothetical protein
MNDESERIWKEEVVAKTRYYPGICMERLKTGMEKQKLIIPADLSEIRSKHR